MSKRSILRLLLLFTLLTLLAKMLKPATKATTAEFVAVERHHVHKIKAITGLLGYADEEYVLAELPSIVSKVCVSAGQRVAVNEALVRVQAPAQEETLSTLLSKVSQANMHILGHFSGIPKLTTIRSDKDATVRQVLIQEGMTTTPGTPLLRISSQEQLIRCTVHSIDAQDIRVGQWAWLFANGEAIGTGTITDISNSQINPLTGFTEVVVTLRPSQHIDAVEGESIDADIYISGSNNVLALPVEAITPRGTVWWVNQGRCTEIPAQIVMYDEMYAWVNLPEGLTVAIGEFIEGQLMTEAKREPA